MALLQLGSTKHRFIVLATALCAVLLLFLQLRRSQTWAQVQLRPTLSSPYRLDSVIDRYEGSGYVYSPERLESNFEDLDPTVKLEGYHQWNDETLRDLHACILLDNCGPNQRKVALLAAHWFEEAMIRGFRGGEGIWAISVYKGLRRLGYTTLFADSWEEALSQYRSMPDLVKVVVRNLAGHCHSDPKCVKSKENPTGIPAWKIFDFEYFSSHGTHYGASLMGGKWILSANPDDNYHGSESPIQYIGFSMEDDCADLHVVRLKDRKDRVWMLMKQLAYVYHDNFAWEKTYFADAARELDMQFVGGWKKDQHYQWDPEKNGPLVDFEDPEHGVINLNHMNQSQFYHEVSMSKIMIGVGDPYWSPSPYNALCLGVPFLNPIHNWDHNNPWDRSRWFTQHPSLVRFHPPYVYHVHRKNYTGFVEAIREASRTEISSFIPKHMTNKALQERLVILMETDWRAKAEILLEENLERDGAYIFEL